MTTSADTPSDAYLVCVHLDHDRLSVPIDLIETRVRSTLAGEGVPRAEIGVVLGHRALVLALNRRYLGHDYPTDVLSFLLSEDEDVLEGEVYVDLDTAEARCTEFDASFEAEVARYAIHGALHLLGYSDETDEQRAAMRELEDRYLGDLRPDEAS